MIALFLSILCSSLIMLVFKGFKRYNINLLQAVVFNYATCSAIGLLFMLKDQTLDSLIYQNWMSYAILLGALFIVIFYGMGYVTETRGVATSTVAAKMGVIFPVLYGIIALGDPTSITLILGILGSILSVYLISRRTGKFGISKAILPVLLVFIGSGAIDLSLKIIQENAQLANDLLFIPTFIIFLSAFTIGLILLIRQIGLGKNKINKESILGGITLGTPNFFSIFFLFQAINNAKLITSFIFPFNNVSVVFLSTILSILFFKEKLNKANIIGLFIAILSIILISY